MIEWYKIIGIVVGLIIIFLIGSYFVKDKTNRNLAKAKNFHKEAEVCYKNGDFDLAEEYYAKADEFRKKGMETA